MRKPNWDTEAGREMWLEGKKDAEIADAFGISVYAVTNYRVRNWQKQTEEKKSAERKTSFSLQKPVAAGAGVDPAILNKIRDNAEKAGIKLPGTAAPGSALAGMKAFDFERGLKPPAGEPEVVPGSATETIPQSPPEAAPAPFTQGSLEEDLTAEGTAPVDVPALVAEERPKLPSRDALDAIADAMKVLQGMASRETIPSVTPMGATAPLVKGSYERAIADRPYGVDGAAGCDKGYTVPKPRLDELDVMAAATEHLSGMKAVCTACAIQALWYWTGPADLRRAKKNIDWLLDHMEG